MRRIVIARPALANSVADAPQDERHRTDRARGWNGLEQFGLPIGRFEGIETPLGQIAATTYWMNAVRVVTAGAVDAGEQPGVMDITGGAGICKGRRNTLAAVYESVPIGITVEGANILTRSLIVFGQGAIRCHPYALAEMRAAASRDIVAFDRALSGHVNFMVRNIARSFVLAISGGALAGAPVAGKAGAVMKRLARQSAAFALITDAAMVTLGGTLKRAENITGRMADGLAWMYIAAATVNRYVASGPPRDEFGHAPARYAGTTGRALSDRRPTAMVPMDRR